MILLERGVDHPILQRELSGQKKRLERYSIPIELSDTSWANKNRIKPLYFQHKTKQLQYKDGKNMKKEVYKVN